MMQIDQGNTELGKSTVFLYTTLAWEFKGAAHDILPKQHLNYFRAMQSIHVFDA